MGDSVILSILSLVDKRLNRFKGSSTGCTTRHQIETTIENYRKTREILNNAKKLLMKDPSLVATDELNNNIQQIDIRLTLATIEENTLTKRLNEFDYTESDYISPPSTPTIPALSSLSSAKIPTIITSASTSTSTTNETSTSTSKTISASTATTSKTIPLSSASTSIPISPRKVQVQQQQQQSTVLEVPTTSKEVLVNTQPNTIPVSPRKPTTTSSSSTTTSTTATPSVSTRKPSNPPIILPTDTTYNSENPEYIPVSKRGEQITKMLQQQHYQNETIVIPRKQSKSSKRYSRKVSTSSTTNPVNNNNNNNNNNNSNYISSSINNNNNKDRTNSIDKSSSSSSSSLTESVNSNTTQDESITIQDKVVVNQVKQQELEDQQQQQPAYVDQSSQHAEQIILLKEEDLDVIKEEEEEEQVTNVDEIEVEVEAEVEINSINNSSSDNINININNNNNNNINNNNSNNNNNNILSSSIADSFMLKQQQLARTGSDLTISQIIQPFVSSDQIIPSSLPSNILIYENANQKISQKLKMAKQIPVRKTSEARIGHARTNSLLNIQRNNSNIFSQSLPNASYIETGSHINNNNHTYNNNSNNSNFINGSSSSNLSLSNGSIGNSNNNINNNTSGGGQGERLAILQSLLKTEELTNNADRKVMDEINKVTRQKSEELYQLVWEVRNLDKAIATVLSNQVPIADINVASSKYNDDGHHNGNGTGHRGVGGNSSNTVTELSIQLKHSLERLLILVRNEPAILTETLWRAGYLREDSEKQSHHNLSQAIVFSLFGNCFTATDERLLLLLIRKIAELEFSKFSDKRKFGTQEPFSFTLLSTYLKCTFGKPYVISVLKDLIVSIIQDHNMNLENDPQKKAMLAEIGLDEEPQVDQNLLLQQFSGEFLQRVIALSTGLPYGLRWISKVIIEMYREHLRSTRPADFEETDFTRIKDSAVERELMIHLIFENFFIPALLRPDHYGVLPGLNISQKTRHNLIQIAKMVLTFLSTPQSIPPWLNESMNLEARINEYFNDLSMVQEPETYYNRPVYEMELGQNLLVSSTDLFQILELIYHNKPESKDVSETASLQLEMVEMIKDVQPAHHLQDGMKFLVINVIPRKKEGNEYRYSQQIGQSVRLAKENLIRALERTYARMQTEFVSEFMSRFSIDTGYCSCSPNIDDNNSSICGTCSLKSTMIGTFLKRSKDAMEKSDWWKGSDEEELEIALHTIERNLMTQIYNYTFSVSKEDVKFTKQLKSKSAIIDHRSLYIPDKYANQAPWELAQQEIRKINLYKSPYDKLKCIIDTWNIIFNYTKPLGESGPDDFLPIMGFVIVKARPENLLSNIQYISLYTLNIDPTAEVWFMNLKSSIEVVKEIMNDALNYHGWTKGILQPTTDRMDAMKKELKKKQKSKRYRASIIRLETSTSSL
ncbi:RasGTPase-activating protein [Heterostelium album PN500]|uniref:RasGTPase-activating protein n=1 Tax=Heterostelium pallidum (strain ATCC 26659 / Pp 5 / PN500) TaxID=670386 RepID=D3BRM7_HETP5|nr:RasGTPase-activating protein [Heterostelium album PN500]EFA76059.1 RasGTPase-activating protein [Heterostelium album PN500]|eukprot:XP_020428193.1 RasGTPase-activating protein [Heterostelium album PN500]